MTTTVAKLAFSLATVAALATAGCDEGQDGRASTSSAAQPVGQASQIVAPAPKHDFGKVKQGKEVSHVFEIRNVGSAPLLIQKAKGS